MPSKYGKSRNLKFEQQLLYTLGEYGLFTYKQAKELYHELHPNDTCFPGMNCTLYLAGAISAGVIRRVRRGVYEWIQ